MLKRTAIVGTTAGIAGCSGDGSGDGDGGDGGGQDLTTTAKSSDGVSISKPWTLEDLKEKSKEEAEGGSVEFNVYSTTDVEKFQGIMDAIEEEHGSDWINYKGVAGNGNRLLTRYLEEARSDRGSKADMLQVRNIFAQESVDPSKWVEGGLNKDYAIAEELGEHAETIMGNRWFTFKEGGATVALMYNPEKVEEEGIDITPLEENGYAALHEEDQYEGLTITQDFTPKERLMGWWSTKMGQKAGMEPIEYAKMMNDKFEWNWTDGHSASSRFVGAGGATFQLLTIPDHVVEFQNAGLPVENIYPKNAPRFVPAGGSASIPKDAQAKWTARFVYAALLSPGVQRRLPGLSDEPPIRPDIDYPDLDDRLEKILKSPIEKVDQETKQEWIELSPKVMEEGFGSPQPS